MERWKEPHHSGCNDAEPQGAMLTESSRLEHESLRHHLHYLRHELLGLEMV
jgi:hypothetical protein